MSLKLKPIKINSQFMKFNQDKSIGRLKKLVGKDVYVDIIVDSGGIISRFHTLVNIQDNKIIFENDISYNINEINAIEEIKNYNEHEFDFDKLIDKPIILTDFNNNSENVIISDYDDKNVYLNFLFEEDGSIFETADWDCPICFIKSIKLDL